MKCNNFDGKLLPLFGCTVSSHLRVLFSCSIKIQTHAMPDYCRYCSIAISKAAGEKRSYNSSKTQKFSLHNFLSPQLKHERQQTSKRVISFPSSCWSSSLPGTSGIVFLPVFYNLVPRVSLWGAGSRLSHKL